MFSINTDKWSSPLPDTLKLSAFSVSSTRRLTSVFNSRNRRSRRCLEVTNLPSCPASGLSFTMNCMAMVGSEIFWNGIATGLSTEQMVSPIWISAIPETATIAPMVASFTSTFASPSNSYSLLIFTLFCFSGSCAFTIMTSWFTLSVPLSILPIPIRPTYSL